MKIYYKVSLTINSLLTSIIICVDEIVIFYIKNIKKLSLVMALIECCPSAWHMLIVRFNSKS